MEARDATADLSSSDVSGTVRMGGMVKGVGLDRPENETNGPAIMKNRIPESILPEGYNGKILLVLIRGAGMEDRIVLRSGDDWHREILRNTQSEIRGYGFDAAQVHELGGAYVSFDGNGNIVIFGSSDDFGACDKTVAAEILRRMYPDRTVRIAD